MLTLEHFLTEEGLTGLLSTATFGNYWPDIRKYKADREAGLFKDCDCCEQKWAVALLKGHGLAVFDNYEMDSELNECEKPTRHNITLDDVKKGLELMREQYPRHWADLVEESEDLVTCDIWLQLTAFGEVIYG